MGKIKIIHIVLFIIILLSVVMDIQLSKEIHNTRQYCSDLQNQIIMIRFKVGY